MVQRFVSQITLHRHQVLLGYVFILLGRLLRFVLLGIEHGSTFCFSNHSSSSSGSF